MGSVEEPERGRFIFYASVFPLASSWRSLTIMIYLTLKHIMACFVRFGVEAVRAKCVLDPKMVTWADNLSNIYQDYMGRQRAHRPVKRRVSTYRDEAQPIQIVRQPMD